VSLIEDGIRLLVTVHPSSLLRIDNSEDRARQYGKFVDDLRVCAKILETLPSSAALSLERIH
jgi:hypothetical protein